MLTLCFKYGRINGMAKTITHQDVLDGLRKRIGSSTLRKVAVELDISAAYLSDIMNGKRDISHKLSKALGLQRKVVTNKVITFVRVR